MTDVILAAKAQVKITMCRASVSRRGSVFKRMGRVIGGDRIGHVAKERRCSWRLAPFTSPEIFTPRRWSSAIKVLKLENFVDGRHLRRDTQCRIVSASVLLLEMCFENLLRSLSRRFACRVVIPRCSKSDPVSVESVDSLSDEIVSCGGRNFRV